MTRDEGPCEGAIDSLGRVAPCQGTKGHSSKTTYRGPAELAHLRVTRCAMWSFGFGAGWDRREIFVFFFGSECARPPGVPRMDVAPGALETGAAVRRFACDLIVHKHTTSATCLRGNLCTAAVDLPGGVGSTETKPPRCDPGGDLDVRCLLLLGRVGVGLRELILRQLGGTRGGRHPFLERLRTVLLEELRRRRELLLHRREVALGELGGDGVDDGLSLLESLADALVVEHESALEARGGEPEDEAALGEAVARDPKHAVVREGLGDHEHGVHDPVGEPLGVVVLGLALDRLVRGVPVLERHGDGERDLAYAHRF